MASFDILVDTTVLIDHFRKKVSPSPLEALNNDYDTIFISVISAYELESGAKHAGRSSDLDAIRPFIDVLDINMGTVHAAATIYADLRKRNLLIPPNDIFVAATALQHNIPLASSNIDHFQRIKELNLKTI